MLQIKHLLSNEQHPVVFFDISISATHIGRITIELFSSIVPKTSENFRQFCTGEFRKQGEPIGYKGINFFKIDPKFVQGGDFVKKDGTGRISIYGEQFEDENFEILHDQPGIVTMYNAGQNSNGCQFLILFEEMQELNKRNVAFGKIIGEQSFEVLQKIRNVQIDENQKPEYPIIINQCGEL